MERRMLNWKAILTAGVLAMGGMAMGTASAQAPVSSITMQRLPCFGACPVYNVEIKADGAVSFHGTRFVQSTGDHTGTASPEAFQSLVAMVEQMDFFNLHDRYRLKQDGCTSWVSDHPTVEITVTRGDESKSVSYYYGCKGVPVAEPIDALSKAIDKAAGTQQWIGAPPPPSGPIGAAPQGH